MTIRAVIFDLGHTLWDIEPGDGVELARVYRVMRDELCARLPRDDVPAADVLQRAVTDVLRDSADTYFMRGEHEVQPASHAWVHQACVRLGLDVDEAILRELAPPLFATEIDRLRCAEGTVEALAALNAEGYALGCVTNTLADGETIRRMLEKHRVLHLMRSVVVSSDAGYRKPHRSLFETALRETGVSAHEAVFVGDAPWHDIAGAREAGMFAVLTHQYVARPLEGVGAKPHATIKHVRELRDVIARLDAGLNEG